MSDPLEQTDAQGSAVHYDTPPGVFQRLLDANMNYSSGYYPNGDEDLDTAQIVKMDRIANVMGMAANQRLLDIGCGWGGPAIYFAERYGLEVTGVNLSPVQRQFALEWAQRRGVQGQVRVDVCNVLEMAYPDASFDHIVFLESIIHMPDKARIFATCARLLKPGGELFVQESNYDRGSMREKYLTDRGFDEVNKAFGYDAYMLSAGQMFCEMEEAGLVPKHLDNISDHYVRTLSQWLQNLDRYGDEMRTISDRAYWMLRRYLMIALATYRSGHTVCHQMIAQKPNQ